MQKNNGFLPFVRERLNFWNIFLLISFMLIGIFFIYPIASILLNSFYSDGEFNLEGYKMFFEYQYYYSALLNSLIVCIMATIFSCIIGIPLAYVMTRYKIPFKGVFHILIILTLLSPPFIGAYSWILMLGNNGYLTQFLGQTFGIETPTIYGLYGMIFVFTLQTFPYIYLYVSGALQTMDSSLEEASESLGMSAWRRIKTITLPLIFPSLSTGMLLVFMDVFSDFGTPMLLGQGTKLIPVLAYEQFISEMGANPVMASTLSMIMLVFTTSVLLLQRYLVAKGSFQRSSMKKPAVLALRTGQKLIIYPFILITLGIALVPQVTVIVTSFLRTNGPVRVAEFSIDNYTQVFYRVPQAITNTFTFSLIAIAFMVVFGMLLAYIIVRRSSKVTAFLDTLIMIPYVLPGTVLGIGLIVAFNDEPLVLTGTGTILIIAYCIRKLPYTLRASTGILHQIDKNVEEASISLGVPPMKTFFKVTAVLMLPGVLSGAILSWIMTINELSATIILYHGATATIPVAIFSEVNTANFGTAAALSAILTLCTTISLIIAHKLAGKRGLVV